jgi:hypothetical protein
VIAFGARLPGAIAATLDAPQKSCTSGDGDAGFLWLRSLVHTETLSPVGRSDRDAGPQRLGAR